jgi:hypothetical protein
VQHGKAAGHIRNEDIIKNADEVLAFWDGMSRGTAGSIEWARQFKKPIIIIHY